MLAHQPVPLGQVVHHAEHTGLLLEQLLPAEKNDFYEKIMFLQELLCAPRSILRRDICEGDVGLAVVLDQGRGSLLLVQDLHVHLNSWGSLDWLKNDRAIAFFVWIIRLSSKSAF